jgi:hypothetical protein
MGSGSRGIYPYMIVEMDGETIGETFVSSDWKKYSFGINTDGGLKAISVTFANDGGDAAKGEDRNMYVGNAEIKKLAGI